jgi:hypothetical protein
MKFCPADHSPTRLNCSLGRCSFWSASWVRLQRRERVVQVVEMLSERGAKIKQLEVLHVHLLRLDFGQPAAGAVPAFELEFCGELFLRPTLLAAQFSDDWTNGVFELWLRHPSR